VAEDIVDLETLDGPDGAQGNPEEQQDLARQVGEDLTDAFVRYVRGELPFEDLTFLTHDALQDVFFIARGDYEVADEDDEFGGGWEEWEDDEAEEDGYDEDEATASQEELAQEPARDG
jgi:hypothetical protein